MAKAKEKAKADADAKIEAEAAAAAAKAAAKAEAEASAAAAERAMELALHEAAAAVEVAHEVLNVADRVVENPPAKGTAEPGRRGRHVWGGTSFGWTPSSPAPSRNPSSCKG